SLRAEGLLAASVPANSLPGRLAQQDADEPLAPPPSAPVAPTDRVGWRLNAAALGLSFAGVRAPIAVTAMAATRGLHGPPSALRGAWAVLRLGVVSPSLRLSRRVGGMILDIVLLSAFLHYDDSAVAGWYPL